MKNYQKLWLVADAAERDLISFDCEYLDEAGLRLESRLEKLSLGLNSFLQELKAGLNPMNRKEEETRTGE